MNSEKPHKGMVENWYIQEFDKEQAQLMYPDEDVGLGYVIRGCVMHLSIYPGGYTSWIMKHEGSEVETRNSRYTLGTPRGS